MSSSDFAAAQKRVAARRQQREQAARERATQYSLNTSIPARVPRALHPAWRRLSAKWALISGVNGTSPAFRVGQVDAELLDEELLELLRGQVGEALKYYGSHLRDEWGAEILLALRAVLFKLTIWDHDASYGASLQNLRYTDARQAGGNVRAAPTRWQKVLYGLLSVGGRYGWTKWEDHLLDIDAGYEEPSPVVQRLSRVSSIASSAYSVAALGSFVVFLLNGQYRTLLDRVLRLRLASSTSRVSHEVSFEYLNRQLVWHAFTEFLLFLLPLVGIGRWKRWLAKAWRKTVKLLGVGTDGGIDDDGFDDDGLRRGGELGFLPERTCAICYQDQNPTSTSEADAQAATAGSSGVIGSAQTDVTNPYEAGPCGCVYCYVCLAQRLEAEDGDEWTCLRCGEPVKECQPWDGDVVRHGSRPGSGKSVSFADDGNTSSDDKERETAKNAEADLGSFTTLDPVPVDDNDDDQAIGTGVKAELDKSMEDLGREEGLLESNEWSRGTTDDDDAVDTLFDPFDPAAALVGDDETTDEGHTSPHNRPHQHP